MLKIPRAPVSEASLSMAGRGYSSGDIKELGLMVFTAFPEWGQKEQQKRSLSPGASPGGDGCSWPGPQ